MIYLISDSHFRHRRIIHHCNRPFNNEFEMDDIMVKNWNEIVLPNDTVYFLGDWCDERVTHHRKWQRMLNGNIISIRGNHDHETHAPYTRILKTDKREYLLVHNPFYREKWNGWLIHGHVHNNNIEDFPFINDIRKTINVSVELTDYKPISIEKIESLIACQSPT